jgi:hypothetical protein
MHSKNNTKAEIGGETWVFLVPITSKLHRGRLMASKHTEILPELTSKASK